MKAVERCMSITAIPSKDGFFAAKPFDGKRVATTSVIVPPAVVARDEPASDNDSRSAFVVVPKRKRTVVKHRDDDEEYETEEEEEDIDDMGDDDYDDSDVSAKRRRTNGSEETRIVSRTTSVLQVSNFCLMNFDQMLAADTEENDESIHSFFAKFNTTRKVAELLVRGYVSRLKGNVTEYQFKPFTLDVPEIESDPELKEMIPMAVKYLSPIFSWDEISRKVNCLWHVADHLYTAEEPAIPKNQGIWYERYVETLRVTMCIHQAMHALRAHIFTVAMKTFLVGEDASVKLTIRYPQYRSQTIAYVRKSFRNHNNDLVKISDDGEVVMKCKMAE
jgi:hypothetical protein